MDYIKEMRELVGNRLLLLVGTSVIAVKDDMILLQKRSDNGKWTYAGGYLEIGEKPEESAKREFYEETGLIALDLELYGVFAGKERYHEYANGHQVYITDVVYVCKNFKSSGNSHDDEVTELKWFKMNELPDNIMSTVKDIIDKFVAEYLK